MNDPTTLHSLDLALRSALVTLALFGAAMLWRDHARSVAARLGAACALGIAAFALYGLPGFLLPPAAWKAPIAALSAGNAVVFWLFTRALFIDDFRLRPWHGAAWGVLAVAGVVNCLLLPVASPARGALGAAITLTTLALALLALGQSVATWRSDLVEGRRRLRLFIVGAGTGYTLLSTVSRLVLGQEATPALVGLIDTAGLAVLVVLVIWNLLGSARGDLFALVGVQAVRTVRLHVPAEVEPLAEVAGVSIATEQALAVTAEDAPADAPANDKPEPIDPRLMAALERLMAVERAYREEAVTIGALAVRLGVPEYRLRRLINQGLGHRNFNAFLNRYRLDEVKAALADPAQAEVPVLTLAMDAGFQSIGPFNRAFKADTGITPTEYRRLTAGASPAPCAPGLRAGADIGLPPQSPKASVPAGVT